MILALFVIGGSLAFLGWLVFTLAIYALPCFAGIAAGTLAHSMGAGVLGTVLAAFTAGVLTAALGRAVLAGTRLLFVRLVILALFVAPAGVVGFGIARDLARLTGTSDMWGIVIGVAGAAVTIAAAFTRLLPDTGGARPGVRASTRPLVAERR